MRHRWPKVAGPHEALKHIGAGLHRILRVQCSLNDVGQVWPKLFCDLRPGDVSEADLEEGIEKRMTMKYLRKVETIIGSEIRIPKVYQSDSALQAQSIGPKVYPRRPKEGLHGEAPRR